MAHHGKHALITNIEELRARCIVDPSTHCWNWTGALTGGGRTTIWAFDHARGEKRTMTGQVAAWNIAHGRAPLPGWLVFRGCCNPACLNPAHLREAKSKAVIGAHMRRSGALKGRNTKSNRENLVSAWAGAGIVPTAPDVVRAIRSADPLETGAALAARYGLSNTTVSRIRLGQSHRHVDAGGAA